MAKVRVIALVEVTYTGDERTPAELGAGLKPLLQGADLDGGALEVCQVITSYTEPVPVPQPPDGF